MKNEKTKKVILRIAAVLLAVCVWQVAATVIHEKILLVTPLQVLLRLTTIWREQGFLSSVLFTLSRILLGFFLGFFSGILLGALSVRFDWLEILLFPWMATIRSVPVASFVVISLIWLSAKNLSVLISFLIVTPIIYQSVRTGLLGVDKHMLELSNVYRLSVGKKIRYVYLPKLRDPLLSACAVSVGMAWKAGVAAEIIAIPNGSIGKMMQAAKVHLETQDLFAWTVLIVLLSVCTEKLICFGLRTGMDKCMKRVKRKRTEKKAVPGKPDGI